MKNVAVILAGGTGSRLRPVTKFINKHLLNVYNRPLIFYPLKVVELCKIKKIFIIVNLNDKKNFEDLLIKYFKKKKIKYEFLIQPKANGIAGALKLLKNKLQKTKKILTILGDNIFIGQGLISKYLLPSLESDKDCSIFSCYQANPNSYGVIQYKKNGKVSKIIEKPVKKVSNDIVTGIYVFKKNTLKYLDKLNKSKFNQYEISDFINILIKNKNYEIKKFGSGMSWFDCGTFETMHEAAGIIRFYQKKYGIHIGNFEV